MFTTISFLHIKTRPQLSPKQLTPKAFRNPKLNLKFSNRWALIFVSDRKSTMDLCNSARS